MPWPSVPLASEARTSGVPAAPVLPSGVAAKVPRRFPTGGSAGGVTEGRIPKAINRPPASAERDACMDGGGGTTSVPEPPRPLCPRIWRPDPPAVGEPVASTAGGGGTTVLPPLPNVDTVRCASTGSWGAGAITSERPILISPSFRMEAAFTAGGGSTTDASGPLGLRRPPASLASGVGAITSMDTDAIARTPGFTSGGGATTSCVSVARLRFWD